MWGVHDEIRAQIKEVQALMAKHGAAAPNLKEKTAAMVEKVLEMIFKEEQILLPMLFEHLTLDEWRRIAADSEDMGYMIENVPRWGGVEPVSYTHLDVYKRQGQIIKQTFILPFGKSCSVISEQRGFSLIQGYIIY